MWFYLREFRMPFEYVICMFFMCHLVPKNKKKTSLFCYCSWWLLTEAYKFSFFRLFITIFNFFLLFSLLSWHDTFLMCNFNLCFIKFYDGLQIFVSAVPQWKFQSFFIGFFRNIFYTFWMSFAVCCELKRVVQSIMNVQVFSERRFWYQKLFAWEKEENRKKIMGSKPRYVIYGRSQSSSCLCLIENFAIFAWCLQAWLKFVSVTQFCRKTKTY